VQYEAHIELAGSSAASGKCSIGSVSGGANKAPTPNSVPMASTDADTDGQPEIVFVNYTSNALKYVDSVRNNNQVRVVTNGSGVTVDGRRAG
jgi:hypothetical protein